MTRSRAFFCAVTLALLSTACTPKQSGLKGIANSADLEALASTVNRGGRTTKWEDSTGVIRLLADIDMSRVKGFRPIGSDSINAFHGTLDGNGFRITGLKIKGAMECGGLFGRNYGHIKNVYLDATCAVQNICASSKSSTGALAGENYGTIENCTNDASVESAAGNTGGICGFHACEPDLESVALISGCANNGKVTGAGTATGGIVGWSYKADITNCLNGGSVAGGGDITGGICGVNGCAITGCTNSGSVAGAKFAGGLAGYNSDAVGVIDRSSNSGAVAGRYAGSLCGQNEVGGVLKNCTNTGSPAQWIGDDKNKASMPE